MRNHDLVFLKHFSQIIAVLFGIMVALILLGLWFNSQQEAEPNEAAQRRIVERIQPVGAVYAGATGMAAAQEAQRLADEAAKAQVAYGGTLDGSVIFTNACGACHNSGAAGAPMLTKAAWAGRTGVGIDTLVSHAIEGYDGPGEGVMPARGGNKSLSDEQVRAAVQHMLDSLK